jgi:hypothetical protein
MLLTKAKDFMDKDVVEMFFEALSKPKESIVTELLSNGLDGDTPISV